MKQDRASVFYANVSEMVAFYNVEAHEQIKCDQHHVPVLVLAKWLVYAQLHSTSA